MWFSQIHIQLEHRQSIVCHQAETQGQTGSQGQVLSYSEKRQTGLMPGLLTEVSGVFTRTAHTSSVARTLQIQKRSSENLLLTWQKCIMSHVKRIYSFREPFPRIENLNPHYEHTWLFVGCQLKHCQMVTSMCPRGPMITRNPLPLREKPVRDTSCNTLPAGMESKVNKVEGVVHV